MKRLVLIVVALICLSNLASAQTNAEFLDKCQAGFVSSPKTWMWKGEVTTLKSNMEPDMTLSAPKFEGQTPVVPGKLSSIKNLAEKRGPLTGKEVELMTVIVIWRDEGGNCFVAINGILGAYEKMLIWQIKSPDVESCWSAWDSFAVWGFGKTWIQSLEPQFTLIKAGKVGTDPLEAGKVIENLVALKVIKDYKIVQLSPELNSKKEKK